MKLPVDNFQILGVGPAANPRTVLMILERKLNKCDFSGFSDDTLRLRHELLKEFSKPLLNAQEREKLEIDYKNLDSDDENAGLVSIPVGYEVAGLLLLLECRLFEECFEISNDLKTSKNDQSINRFEDLPLIIAYATLEYGRELKSKRYYENAAQILEHGLSQIQEMIVKNDLQETIRKELDDIIPYRILDLLSREMDEPARERGIKLLNEFVLKRGGLDGMSSLYMNDEEFKSFFRQIRYFLTVQEQIDLYKPWYIGGSQSACFLLGVSLVADGFARRKPERLVEALEIMKRLDPYELQEVIIYISLLLGKVEMTDSVPNSLQNKINDTSIESSQNTLGHICSGCRDWLESDVLEGYRDLEGDPDLEAYFNDRDVTGFIERNDLIAAERKTTNKSFLGPVGISSRFLDRSFSQRKKKTLNSSPYGRPDDENEALYDRNRRRTVIVFTRKWILSCIAIVGSVILLKLFGWHANYKQKTVQSTGGGSITSQTLSPVGATSKKSEESRYNVIQNKFQTVPDKTYITSILSKWLAIKANTLSGKEIPEDASLVATKEAIERLKLEREEDKSRGETQMVSAKVVNMQIISVKNDKIDLQASLSYTDKRINRTNDIIEKTPMHVFKKRYILVNRNSRWLVQ